MSGICSITREQVMSEPALKVFRPVSGELSVADVATILEVFELYLDSGESVEYVKDLLSNRSGHFLFYVSKEPVGTFDLYKYINERYPQDVVINCMNAKRLFPRGMSSGVFIYEGQEEYDEEGATGYMDEDEEIEEELQSVCNLAFVSAETGKAVPISSETLIMGRSSKQSGYVVKGSTNVSRAHCKIRVDGSSLKFTDISGNGSYRNGVRLTKGVEVELSAGDDILLADVLYRVVEE